MSEFSLLFFNLMEEARYVPKSLIKVQTPFWVRFSAYALIAMTMICILMFAFIPWQQTVMGTGRITAFSPNNRPQQIESPIKGRIKRWYVQEGMQVKKGDLIVELQDLEKEFLPPEIIQLTLNSREALVQNRIAYLDKANSIEESIANLRQNLTDSLNAAQQNVAIAKGDLQTAHLNLKRTINLADKGLASERDKELAIQAEIKASGDLKRAEVELERISSKTLSEITKLESEKASSLADAAKASDEIAKIDAKLSTAMVRKDISHIRSPIDGIVVKLYKRGPGETFKENEKVAVITPETLDQAAELYVSDIDAPLISPGNHVRLQFSGWPALQFAGFSESIKLGTFGGTVAVVDNVDSGNGKYRILVVPEKTENKWPSARFLRPGTRVAGWVILKTVPLGYELWRRFNGFPIGLSDLHDSNAAIYSSEEGIDGDYKESNKKTDIIYKKKSK